MDKTLRIATWNANGLISHIESSVFLDVAQAFDKVWHEGLEYKLK